jgi:hypothetical protein
MARAMAKITIIKKSRIRETKHLSTDADGSTDAIGGWTKAKSAKKNILLRGDFRPLPNENVQMLDQFFPLLFPKDSESLKILDIRLQEVGAKRPLKKTENQRRQKKVKKKTFFCAAILDNFQTKMFISETTSFNYFSPRIPNL